MKTLAGRVDQVDPLSMNAICHPESANLTLPQLRVHVLNAELEHFKLCLSAKV
jgi:hypothetical protein